MIQMLVTTTETIPKLIKEQPQPWAFCLKRAVQEFEEELSKFRPVRSKPNLLIVLVTAALKMLTPFQSAQLRIVGHAVLCEYKSITRMRTDTKKRAKGLKTNDNLNSKKVKVKGKKK